MLQNIYFSDYSGTIPDKWNKKNDSIMSATGIVGLTKDLSINSYANAVKVSALSPCVGIEQSFTSTNPGKFSCNLKNASGRSFINLARANDSSAFMDISQVPNYSYSACRGVNYIRLNNGKQARIFTLANNGESSSTGGQLYIQVDGESPRSIKVDSTCQQLMSTYIQYDNKEVIIYHKIQNSKTTVSILESTDSFATISRSIDLLTYTEDMQCYSAIKCSNGKTILPYLRATNGVYYLDILVSNDDLATWTTLNQFKVCPQRGLMETKAIELSNNKVVLYSRTEFGYLAKNILDLSTMTLGDYSLTDIATTSTAFSLIRVDNDTIALAWCAGNLAYMISGNYNLPRQILCLGFYNADMTVLKSVSIIATVLTHSMSFTNYLPYIHSPMIFLDSADSDKIVITYEGAYSSESINSFEAVGSLNKLSNLNNTAIEVGDNSVSIEYGAGTYKLQLLSCIDKTSTFTIDNVKLNNVKLNNDILKLKVEDKIVDVPLKVIDNDYAYIHLYNDNDNDNRGLSLSEVENINDVINNGYKYELKINDDGLIKTLLCIK